MRSIVLHRLAGLWLVSVLILSAPPAAAQIIATDARRIGMGGLTLDRGGSLRRYNAAYRAVPERESGSSPRFTIPIPLGLIQVLGDSAAFDTDADYWNPIRLVNYVMNAPLFYEIKQAPTPTNDVEFTIGKNELIVDLGSTRAVIPSDEFGIGGTSRLVDLGGGFKGFRVGVQGWLHYEVGFRLGDTLRTFLRDVVPAQNNTRYNVLGDAIGAGGFAPTVSYSGRLAGDSVSGFYLGAAVRYYLGVAYGRTHGSAGFVTGDTIFASNNPVTPNLEDTTAYSTFGNALGRGIGADLGAVWITGPLEIGLGVNDIGAALKWTDTRIERAVWDTAGDSIVTTTLANHVETEFKLPVSYIANLAYTWGPATTLGAQVVNSGRGTRVTVGAEQRIGVLAIRGGLTRDQRKRMQFAAGTGVRLGPVSLDLGFWTHSNSFSDERAITMATSVSIY